MHRVEVKKAVNRLKATIERRHGPAEKSQDAAPIADAMQTFWERGMLTFTIPAHNGGRGPAPEFTRWAGLEAARFDLPMSHGVDTRDRAWQVRSEQRMLPRDAFFAAAETVKPDEAVGRVSAELITPYPPGIPAVAPGEVFNEANVAYLEEIVANGAFVEGASDPSLEELRVVA